MLMVADLQVSYGGIRALRSISFTVAEGEIVTLIGANGAGKTTTLRAISGLVPEATGEIIFAGQNLRTLSPHRMVELGIAHVPEGRRVFANLTVRENLELGGYLRILKRQRRAVMLEMERVFALFGRLKERETQMAGTLSGGEQQMLAIGRALMTGARLLLLDEPSMGLAPFLVKQIFPVIQEVNREGTTILLVEQNAKMALKIAHRAYVLQTGEVVLSGPAQEVARDERVRKAYLGG
jgi:branched-chain amino acid transport system ATP-binding protein